MRAFEGWGLALTPGVHSQVLGRQLCIISPSGVVDIHSLLKVVTKQQQQQQQQQTPWPFELEIANAQIERSAVTFSWIVKGSAAEERHRQWWSFLHPAPAVFQAPTPLEEFAPLPAVFQAPSPVVEKISPAPAVVQAPTPVVKSVAPVPAVHQAPTPVVEYLAPAPAVFLAPVEEYISPVPVVDTAPCTCRGVHRAFIEIPSYGRGQARV